MLKFLILLPFLFVASDAGACQELLQCLQGFQMQPSYFDYVNVSYVDTHCGNLNESLQCTNNLGSNCTIRKSNWIVWFSVDILQYLCRPATRQLITQMSTTGHCTQNTTLRSRFDEEHKGCDNQMFISLIQSTADSNSSISTSCQILDDNLNCVRDKGQDVCSSQSVGNFVYGIHNVYVDHLLDEVGCNTEA